MGNIKNITKVSTRLDGEGNVIRLSLAYKDGEIVTYKDDDCKDEVEILKSGFEDMGYKTDDIFNGHLVVLSELKKKKEHHPVKTAIKITSVCAIFALVLGSDLIINRDNPYEGREVTGTTTFQTQYTQTDDGYQVTQTGEFYQQTQGALNNLEAIGDIIYNSYQYGNTDLEAYRDQSGSIMNLCFQDVFEASDYIENGVRMEGFTTLSFQNNFPNDTIDYLTCKYFEDLRNSMIKAIYESNFNEFERLHQQFISDYYKLAYYAFTFRINGYEVKYDDLSPMCKDILVDYAMAINAINYDYKYVVEDIPFNREGFATVLEQIGDDTMHLIYDQQRTR